MTLPGIEALPVLAVMPALRDALATHRSAVLSAPPGSGKTTAVPLKLLAESWLAGGVIVVLEPRRVAARAAARRMAAMLGEPVGETVGYQVRFDRRAGPRTRIEVVTEGILSRRLQDDPEMPGVGLVIFDEFHERSLHADLALALCLDARTAWCGHLRVLVMSATLDSAPIAALLGDVPTIVGGGRPHPVEVRYEQRVVDAASARTVSAAVRRALHAQDKDVLAFLPGAREIRAVALQLDADGTSMQASVFPLYGNLPPREQDRAISADPVAGRRIILATNIAETSLTIEGVGAVVDSGLARRMVFEPNTGLSRLKTVNISRASAQQRAGRAGRLGSGLCFRLWTEADHRNRASYDPPEIAHADLSGLVLELAAWGTTDARTLQWLDLPPAGAVGQARSLLQRLRALDRDGRVTAHGRAMAGLPVHPRLASMLAAAADDRERRLACDLAAMLDAPDVLPRGDSPCADIAERVEAMSQWRHRRAPGGGGTDREWDNHRAFSQVQRGAEQLARRLGVSQLPEPESSNRSTVSAVGRLLLQAYPDRLARRRGAGGSGYRLASGRGVSLANGDPLAREEFLVAADLDAGRATGRIYRAAGLHGDDVAAFIVEHGVAERRIEWDAQSEAVVAASVVRVGALDWVRATLTDVSPEELREAMLDGIRSLGLAALPWNESAIDLRVRVQCLAKWRPSSGWPCFDDQGLLASLNVWLGPFLDGVTRRSHLKRIDLSGALRAAIPYALGAQLEEGAPLRLTVPSGSRIKLKYQPDAAPVLAVKLQEMFGASTGPTVCWGEVPVMIHLLSPAGRPVQITQDLAGFWRTGYPEVRKELRGRYPKHPWPEDPTTATATRKTRRAG